MPRSLLLSSEYSQLLKTIQNTVVAVKILWVFFSFSCSPPLYYILLLRSLVYTMQFFSKINELVSKWQEYSHQWNGNDGAKHVMVSGSLSSVYS